MGMSRVKMVKMKMKMTGHEPPIVVAAPLREMVPHFANLVDYRIRNSRGHYL